MADKLRKTYPLRITFTDGEQPTGSKLSAISEQTRNGLAIVEKAIGDLWTQSGDAALTDFPLQIPNLGRMLGENKYLNPAIYPMTETFEFVESIGSKLTGRNEGYLLFRPMTGSTYTITNPGSGMTGSPQTNEADVDASGKWWVDETTGRIRTYEPLGGTEKLTYEVDPEETDNEWVIGQETLPGVIPDPRQTSFTSCRVEKSGSIYLLHLPPRQPLASIDDARERPASYPLDAEFSDNKTTSALPYMYWQSDSVNAFTGSNSAHYRYAFPKEIQDASLALGSDIPAGYMYLYNKDEGTVIEDVVFKIPSTTDTGYTLEVSSSTFDFDTVDTSDETEASYSGTNLVLITCATPISRAVWSTLSMFLRHEHTQGNVLDAVLDHSKMKNMNPPDANYTGTGPTGSAHNTVYPSHLPSWFSSYWPYDPHTSLLSRAGSQSTGYERDVFNNAMLGDLILANADTSGAESYLDGTCTDGSFKLYFGDTDGPYIYGTGSDSIVLSDKVGIGEPSPFAKLHVRDSDTGLGAVLARNQQLVLENNGSCGMAIISKNDSLGSIVFADANDNYMAGMEYDHNTDLLSFRSGDGQRMYIDSSGNVGIGVAPSDNLHVQGTNQTRVRIEDIGTGGVNTPGFVIYNESSFEGGLVYVEARDALEILTAADGTYGAIRISGSTGNVGIGSANYTIDTLLHLYGDAPDITFEDTSGDKFLCGNRNGDWRVYNVTDTREDFTIDGAGKVGIGEDTPLGTVHIKTADVGAISPETSADDLVIEGSGSTGLTIYSGNTSTGNIHFGDVDDDDIGYIRFDHNANSMELRTVSTSSSSKVFINSSGHVGIGCEPDTDCVLHICEASTGYTPSIYSNVIIESNDTYNALSFLGTDSSYQSIYFGDDNSASVGKITYYHSDDTLTFTVGSGTRMTIDGNGDVGIGTTSISTRLTVFDTAQNWIAAFANDGNLATCKGLWIQCGKDTPTANDDCRWLELADGNGSSLSYLTYNTADPFAYLVASSDARLKTNIQSTSVNGLEVINNIPLRSYDWIEGIDRPSQKIGYVAQEVKDIYPPMVSYREEDDEYFVGDSVLVRILVKAVQELSQQVTDLEARLDASS